MIERDFHILRLETNVLREAERYPHGEVGELRSQLGQWQDKYDRSVGKATGRDGEEPELRDMEGCSQWHIQKSAMGGCKSRGGRTLHSSSDGKVNYRLMALHSLE